MIKSWEEIINTAIIGTDKRNIDISTLPIELKNDMTQIETLTTDKELQFLHLSAIISNYRKAGYLPIVLSGTAIQECPDEEKKYCSASAMSALQAVLDDENKSLLFYWLTLCHKNLQIVMPEYIPVLFEKAEKETELREIIISCCGERGKWIAQFNPTWMFQNPEESFQLIFDHGKLEERKSALTILRTSNPEEARLALEKTWAQEQAATKAELLRILEINLQLSDEVFIKECWKEKSSKVKEVALQLLKQIPGSFVIEDIWQFTHQLITFKKSSSIFGLLNKETIDINLSFEIPEHFKTYGISHIDANKVYSEKEFTLSQLISTIPLLYWEKHFNLNANEILLLFDRKEETQKFISSFASAANTFKNIEWSKILYLKYQRICLATVKEFDEEMQQQILLSYIQNFKDIYQILSDRKKEWNTDFAYALLEKTSQEPYTFNKVFYKNIIHHLPTNLSDKIDRINLVDEMKSSYWINLREEIKRMLAIKQHINQSF